jgi:hypothetical protein
VPPLDVHSYGRMDVVSEKDKTMQR